MLSEDSNGQSEIVAVALIVNEDKESMLWIMNTFKLRNEEWAKVRVVMGDKDMNERNTIKQSFPSANVLICLFHTLRTFRREVTCGITSGQRSTVLEYLQKIAYASSDDEYARLYEEFKQSLPKAVLDYFNNNWHCINDEWTLKLKGCCGTFLNSTNNRLESINAKLKQTISRNSSLEEFVNKFFVILTSLRTERDHKAILMQQRVKIHSFPEGSPEMDYSCLLTTYATKYVIKLSPVSF